jgi:hypothetical protein
VVLEVRDQDGSLVARGFAGNYAVSRVHVAATGEAVPGWAVATLQNYADPEQKGPYGFPSSGAHALDLTGLFPPESPRRVTVYAVDAYTQGWVTDLYLFARP